jgi:hypothetical protein
MELEDIIIECFLRGDSNRLWHLGWKFRKNLSWEICWMTEAEKARGAPKISEHFQEVSNEIDILKKLSQTHTNRYNLDIDKKSQNLTLKNSTK